MSFYTKEEVSQEARGSRETSVLKLMRDGNTTYKTANKQMHILLHRSFKL